jgi:hypothetical protein
LRLLEKRAKQGKRTPAWDNKPELYEDLIPVWNAFAFFQKRREAIGKIDQLSLMEIYAWLDNHGIEDYEERIEWEEMLIALDNTLIKWQKKRQEKEDENDGNSTDSDRRKKGKIGRKRS